MQPIPSARAKRKHRLSPTEAFRRVRLGDHYRYLRGRYPDGLPGDDGGREDLYELLLIISLAAGCYRKMKMAIKNWAGWMSEDEAEQLVDSINRTPDYQRKRTARQMGEIWNLTYAERQSWGIRTVAPCDISEVEFLRRRRDRRNFRALRRRLAAGRMTRAQYRESLRNSLSQTKPWEAECISRRTWERRRKQADARCDANKAYLLQATNPASLSKLSGERKMSAEIASDRKSRKQA